MTAPSVSCVIPVFNGERFLGEAIASVLAQTHAPIEVVVVDDGSTDGTRAVAASFGTAIRCEWQANAGPAAARNRGIALAAGDIVAFLDADDLWEPAKIARQMAALAAQPDAEMATTLVSNFWEAEVAHEKLTPAGARLAQQTAWASGSSLVARRGLLERIGGFDASRATHEITEWFMKVQAASVRNAMVPEVLARRRLHTGNRSRADSSRMEVLALMREARKRRDTAPGPGGAV